MRAGKCAATTERRPPPSRRSFPARGAPVTQSPNDPITQLPTPPWMQVPRRYPLSMPLVETSCNDAVATVTMTHMEKRNALSSALIEAVLEALDWAASREARCVVLRAPAGAKVFSAGHDVNELPMSGRDPLGYSDPLEQLVRAIRKLPAPVVAMIEGSVWGGACEVCISCDILIGTHTATFAATPGRSGSVQHDRPPEPPQRPGTTRAQGAAVHGRPDQSGESLRAGPLQSPCSRTRVRGIHLQDGARHRGRTRRCRSR